ncbi:hypothetical protein AB205_0128250 [Aquarana catesbeiana]|uniref:Uncharacterized protein n=1 Tax=Aquarana catesbeiana TaxID=8400 RepID=A0A2G9SBW4_AQUCT|nr:hypothetical protein AB205_0128250 [Aquarana catesbeiana]
MFSKIVDREWEGYKPLFYTCDHWEDFPPLLVLSTGSLGQTNRKLSRESSPLAQSTVARESF